MKVVFEASIWGFEKYFNRQIKVSDDICLRDFCDFVITSFNGEKIPFYSLFIGNDLYMPFDNGEDYCMKDVKLSEFDLKDNSEWEINYDSSKFNIILKVIEKYKDDSCLNNGFEVIYGRGVGLLDEIERYELDDSLYGRDRNKDSSKKKVDLYKYIDVLEVNKMINEYVNNRKNLSVAKHYFLNVSLEGYGKSIKRKLVINNNATLNELCTAVIVSMRGDMSHCYALKRNKNYYDNDFYDLEIFNLNLKEKQRFKVIYDFGDNWIFNVSVSKIVDEYNKKKCEVISGKGYGIVDDCGGVWGLQSIFSKSNDEIESSDDGSDDENDDEYYVGWEKKDINDFDLDECNSDVQDYVN